MSITLSRIVAKGVSSWEETLRQTISAKLLRKLKNKEEATQMLRVYSSNCENIVRNICKANQSKKIFKIIDEWLNQMHKVPIDRIRDVLYNIEQFKLDAFKLPEIKSALPIKLQASSKTSVTGILNSKKGESIDGPVYGQGAKSAGSIGGSERTSSGANKMLAGGNQG